MSLREDQVEMAVRFLSNDKVVSRPQAEKEGFLANKGLTQEEIAEAFKRSEKGDSSTASSSAPATVPGISSAASTSVPAASAPAAPTAPPPAAAAAVAPATAPQTAQPPPAAALPAPPAQAPPAMPQYPNSAPQQYPQLGQVPPYAQMQMPPPWAYQGYAPPPEPPSEGGAWWTWLLGGLGAGLAGTLLLNPLRSRFDDSGSSQIPWTADATTVSKPPAIEQEVASNSHSAGTGGEPDGKASYEELLTLLRQQSEEARENAAMCAKALQTTQEQHQKMFAEMHKALQTATQHSKKPQPTELSASTIQSLATMIRGAGPSTDSAPATVGTSPAAPAIPQAPAMAPVSAAPSVPPAPAAQIPPAALPTADGAGVIPNVPLSLRESFDAINSSLQRLVTECSTKAEAVKSMNTVAMVLGNLLKDPSSDRNRKVNTSSSRFSEIFRNEGAASELLKLAGFQYQAPNFTFSTDGQVGTEGVQRVLDLLQEAQRGIDQAWAARQPAAENSVCTPAATVSAPAATASDEALRPPTAARPWARDASARTAAPAMPWTGQMQTADDGSQQFPAMSSSVPSQAPPAMAPAAVAANAASMVGAVAHPAESLPRAVAHPAESEARAPAPQLLPSAEPASAGSSSTSVMVQQAQQQQPQQMRLPIAHPAEVAPVTAAHPAESPPSEIGMAPAHPAEAPSVHAAEVAMPPPRSEGTSPAHPAESSGTSVSEEPQSGG